MMTTTTQPTIGTGVQRWLGGLGVILSTAAFGVIAGPVGLLPGIILVAAWYWLSAVVGFAFGHTALLLFSQTLSSPAVLAVEAGLACLLVSSALGENGSWRTSIKMAITFVLLGVMAWFGQEMFDTLWLGSLLLTITVTLVAYVLYRYERVKLGFEDEL